MIKDLSELSDKEFKESFYFLCSEPNKILDIKKIFLQLKTKQKITEEVLLYGIFSASKNNNIKCLDIIFNFIEKNNLKLKLETIEPFFNICCKKKLFSTLDYLNEKTSIIEQSMNKHAILNMDEKGEILTSFGCGELENLDNFSLIENKIKKYSTPSFLFNCMQENQDIINLMLNKITFLNHSLIEEVFIESCQESKIKTIITLIENDKSNIIINNSDNIKKYLSFSPQNKDIKENVISILNNVNLKKNLNISLNNSQENSKLKIKI